jgi:MFS family permease
MSTALQQQKATSYRQLLVSVYAAAVAFLTYASVYAYRKPFTVATFDGIKFWGISYQTLLIISQVIGYMLSKFYGIKFISELKRLGRWKTILVLMSTAWISLLIFAITPPPYGMLLLFLNGFVLGFLWGIVFSYVEGRRATDFIGSVLAVSFIFAGGFCRSVAKWLMVEWSVTEKWMPFMTGLVFALPLALFVILLERIPPPDEMDVSERTERLPMTKEDRKQFLKLFSFGIIAVTITYLFLSVMRDIRDNYMANIWNELGYGNDYSIFTKTETNTSVIVLIIISFLVLIRKNLKAFRVIHFIIIAGFLLAGISSWLFISNKLSGDRWMQLVGLGLYMGYVPFNCIFFERMIATFRIKGNVGFLIYLADAYGYAGSVAVMLAKNLFDLKLSWSGFYSYGVAILSIIGVAGTIFSLFYFNNKYRVQKN